jgi:hypothetical protein
VEKIVGFKPLLSKRNVRRYAEVSRRQVTAAARRVVGLCTLNQVDP